MRARRTLAAGTAAAAVAVALSRRPSLVPRGGDDQAILSALAAALGLTLGAGASESALLLGRAVGGRSRGAALLASAGAVAWWWGARPARRGRAASAVESAGTGAAVAAAAGEAGALVLGRVPGAAPAAATAGFAVLAARAGPAFAATRGRIAEPRDLVKASIDYRYGPAVSGGEGSLLPLAALDREGRKFLGLAPAADEIAAVVGGSAGDPVRVYAGLGSGDDPEARARLALDELERLGGLRRSRVLVACPVGSGLVNPVFVWSEELMSRGDVATVAVQYSNARSLRALRDIPLARETYRRLLGGLRDRVERLPPGERPEVVFYGESLGAWVAAEMIAEGGLELLRAYGIERGALLGTPHDGARKLVRLRRERSLPDEIGILERAADLDTLGDEARARLRYVVLTHPDDPVANYTGPELLWRRPFWLRRGAPRAGVPPGMRWMPGITFFQALLDVKNGTSFDERFEARAHDYRAEHPAIVRAAFGHEDVTDDGLRAVGEWTRARWRAQRERERAARS